MELHEPEVIVFSCRQKTLATMRSLRAERDLRHMTALLKDDKPGTDNFFSKLFPNGSERSLSFNPDKISVGPLLIIMVAMKGWSRVSLE
jgi:hypothetical protein